uniref:Interleukin-12 subunit beta-like n=1 Tax=Callorhinchus milii TaxID=7868 RepID=A0A4W3GGZ3_CALMI
ACPARITLPVRTLILERNMVANLSCDNLSEEVIWLRDGEAVQGGTVGASGQLIINNADQPDAGNYTCMRNGVVVAHTYLFITEEDKPPIFESDGVKCISRNFNGMVTCSWKTKSNNSLFRVKYCRSTYSLFSFLLYDTVKPDPPQAIKCTITNCKLNARWEYPAEWPKPHSYFPLTFQISYSPIRNSSKNKTVSGKIQEGISMEGVQVHKCKAVKICIRAKDSFLNSPWSEWSIYQTCNVRH